MIGKGSLLNRWHCTNGCIRTWRQWYLCMKISLTFAHFIVNSLRSPAAIRLKILVGWRSLVSGDQDRYHHHCILLWSTTSLYLLKEPRNWGPWLGGTFYSIIRVSNGTFCILNHPDQAGSVEFSVLSSGIQFRLILM